VLSLLICVGRPVAVIAGKSQLFELALHVLLDPGDNDATSALGLDSEAIADFQLPRLEWTKRDGQLVIGGKARMS
jgi:hypothetical protein